MVKSFSQEEVNKNIKNRDKAVEKELARIQKIIDEKIVNTNNLRRIKIQEIYKLKFKCKCQYCRHYHDGCKCYETVSTNFKKWNCSYSNKRDGCFRNYLAMIVVKKLKQLGYIECNCTFASVPKYSLGSYKEYLYRTELMITFLLNRPLRL